MILVILKRLAASFQRYIRRDGHLLALPLMIAGLFGVYVKVIALTSVGGFLVATRALGLVNPDDLPLAAKLGFIRNDICVNVLLIPIGFSVLASTWLSGRSARIATLVVCYVLLAMYFVALLSLVNVGRLISFDMLLDAIHFGTKHIEDVSLYVSIRSVLKLLSLAVCVPLLIYFKELLAAVNTRVQIFDHLALAAFLSGVAVAIAMSCVTFIDNTPKMIFHRTLLAQALLNLRGHDDDRKKIDVRSAKELVQLYRTFVDAPAYVRSPYFGLQRGSDVIFIVLETEPMASVEIDGGLESLTAIGGLIPHAAIGRRHFSTYPYTSDAMFSIFGGMYPVALRKAVASPQSNEIVGSALPNVLAAAGYKTYRYAYEDTFESDKKMFQAFGMREFFQGDTNPLRRGAQVQEEVARILKRVGPLSKTEEKPLRRYLETDISCLIALRQQIVRSKGTGQRFMAAFFPIVGHGPWPRFGGESNVRARGRRLIELQDPWVGAILDELRGGGWLQDTIVIVTADHGIRTTQEDPDLQIGKLNSYSYLVPLVVAAPKAFPTTVAIEWPTSHIDLAPTVLELLGFEPTAAPLGQGNLIFNRKLADRTTFMFAGAYHGLDGFTKRGRYFMKRNTDDQRFANDTFSFPSDTFVSPGSETALMIDNTLATINGIQEAWVEFALQSPQSTNK